VSAVETVLGERELGDAGTVDAHDHLFIAPGPEGAPELADERLALEELHDLRAAGGAAVVDCQPGGCGRDARVLRRLMERSDVAIVASTGFHLRRYYRPGEGPWASPAGALDLFLGELLDGLREEPGSRAGVVKCAWTGEPGAERELLAAAAEAARRAGAAMVVHTEPGGDVGGLCELVLDAGVAARRVQLSHLDKQPDPALHLDLARAGFVLGYDTFLRPKYRPDEHVWPLLRTMVAEGHAGQVTLGLDLVDAARWRVCGGPGLRALPAEVVPRLSAEGTSAEDVNALAGGNARRLLAREEAA
jgi:predicted metal-dependent phosphotriesterase family hydrolase